MAFQISRLYDFQPGTKILSSQVDAELSQLVNKHNSLDSATDQYKSLISSNTGATNVGITPVAGMLATDDTLQKFILAEVTARLSHTNNVSNPHGVTSVQVGLGNVTNDKQATEVNFNAHTSNVSNPHSVTKAQVGLGNVTNTSDADKPVSTAQLAALNTKVDKETGKSLISTTLINKLDGIESGAEVNVQSDFNESNNQSDSYIKNKPTLGTASDKNVGVGAGNIPILDASGKLEVSVLPALAISETFVVNTQSAMLALTAQKGDVAVRTDLNKSFILRDSPSTLLSNWQELLTPTDLVLSVCGKTGSVVLSAKDVGALDTNDIVNLLTSTASDKALSAAQGKVLKDLVGDILNLNGFFVGSPACIVDALNNVGSKIGSANFSVYYGGITTLIGALNKLATDKVTSSNVLSIKAENGRLYFSMDDTVWVDCTGPQGIQGKGYNPRGPWVSGTQYTNSNTTIDVVESGGSSYYCKNSVVSTTAPGQDTTNWGLMALSGTAALASQIPMTGYSVAGQYSSVSPTDTVVQAVAKLEKSVIDYNSYKTETLDPTISLTDQLLRQGIIINLPPVTDTPSSVNVTKTYTFATPNLKLLTSTLGTDLSFLNNAYVDLEVTPTTDSVDNRSKVSSNAVKVTAASITDTLVSGYTYSVTGTFTVTYQSPVGVELSIKPRLVIPGLSGSLTSFT